MENGNNGFMLTVAALIVGIIAGGFGGYAYGKDANMDEETTVMATATPMAMAESDGVTVGGAKMVRTLDIVDNAAKASNVTTVVSLVQKADLVDTLKGAGPFTVFGPDNAAFAKLPAETVASLQMPENKATLAKILTYHVVSGTYTSADLMVMASKGQSLTSVEGDMLMPIMENGTLKIKDVKGGVSTVKTADVISSNGVTHVVDSVLMPN